MVSFDDLMFLDEVSEFSSSSHLVFGLVFTGMLGFFSTSNSFTFCICCNLSMITMIQSLSAGSMMVGSSLGF